MNDNFNKEAATSLLSLRRCQRYNTFALIVLLFCLALFLSFLFHSGAFISRRIGRRGSAAVHATEDGQETKRVCRPPFRHLVLHQPEAAAYALRRWLQALCRRFVPRVRGHDNVPKHLRQDLDHPPRQGEEKRHGRLAFVP